MNNDIKLKPHIENILKERYYLKNENSWEQVAKRVSVVNPDMYDNILNREFIPSTPTLMNLNTNGEKKGTLSSCFILDIEDNMEGIMDSMKDAALVTKAAGGVGFCFSKLRSSNEVVKSNGGKSGGILSFIGIFDSVLDGVRQGSARRGAGMSLYSIYGGDILKFIDAKASDTKKYTRSNFSIVIDNAFYKILKNTPDKVFKTKNVTDGQENELKDDNGLVYTYKMLWDKIIHNSWKSAEPGIFNGEIAADRCSCKHISRNIHSNPCVTGDTKILIKGKKHSKNCRIDKLVGKRVEVWNGREWSKVEIRITGYDQPILKIKTSSGKSLKCTRYHSFILSDETRVKAIDLKIGDKLFSTKEIDSGSVISIEDSGVSKIVYCFNEPILNRGTFNGIITSQCSEYVHLPYTSCNLGSINLSLLLDKDNKFDWKKFEILIEKAVVYLNGIIDVNDYPIDKIRKETLAVRPIGLGEMGLAHLLYLLKIPYDSEEAYELTRKINKFMTLVGMRKSVELAKKNKRSYDYYDYDTYIDANKRFFNKETFMGIDLVKLKEDIKNFGIYNSCITSVAPTGTISYLSDCSGGIEPVFGLVFTRKIEKENKNYEYVYIVDPVFEKYVEEKYPDKKNDIYEYISNNSGSCQGCKLLTKEEQSIFKVAGDITPDWHLEILSAVANNVSLSVSKTTNLPKDCSEKEVGDIFIKAHELGIIGVTVYRDGSREGILIHKDSEKTKVERRDAPKRPTDLNCDIHEMNITTDGKAERLVALVGKLNGAIYEIFVTKDSKNKLDFNAHKHGVIRKVKKGRYDLVIQNGEEKVYIEDISSIFGGPFGILSRLVSMSLRHGVPLQILVSQLQKNTTSSFFEFDRCVARILKKYIKEGEVVITSDKCPKCGSKLIYVEGCKSCSDKIGCGYSCCG